MPPFSYMCGGIECLCSSREFRLRYKTPHINHMMTKNSKIRLTITVSVIFMCGWEGYTSNFSNIHHYWDFNTTQIWGVFTLWCFFVWQDLSEFHKALLKLSPFEHLDDTSNSTKLLGKVGFIFTICSVLIFFKYL